MHTTVSAWTERRCLSSLKFSKFYMRIFVIFFVFLESLDFFLYSQYFFSSLQIPLQGQEESETHKIFFVSAQRGAVFVVASYVAATSFRSSLRHSESKHGVSFLSVFSNCLQLLAPY